MPRSREPGVRSLNVAADAFTFGPFELDPAARHLRRDGQVIPLPPRHFDLLLLLVSRAREVLSKDTLVEAAWAGIAVTDNSVEQAISGLRRALAAPDGTSPIETQARRGYRFTADVRRVERRANDDTLEALLAPHRAWIEGRAALETLERSQIVHAREVFEKVLASVPDSASAHVGLANACIMQFEMTRTDLAPDRAALATAAHHAKEACRLDPRYGEAWATLGFVLDRTGRRDDALAASRMAIALEPDNWRHHLRLAYVSWGEERLREARRTLALLPGFPLAHWLAATVHVARQAFDEAERELAAGLSGMATTGATRADGSHEPSSGRFGAVALHWLRGLLRLACGDEAQAVAEFEHELADEPLGQLYARECCANTWYAIAAVRHTRADADGVRTAFAETVRRLPLHPGALAATSALLGAPFLSLVERARALPGAPLAEVALGDAVGQTLRGNVDAAVSIVEQELAAAPAGSALWTLPVDPFLRPTQDARWAGVLATLRNRAS